MIAIILVGGFGTRLRPLTLSEPKPLLPILNIPFLAYQLSQLKKSGINKVVLAVGKDLKPWLKKINKIRPQGQKIYFSIEQAPLGTGGAIKQAYDYSLRQNIKFNEAVVLNGDVFLSLDFAHFLGKFKRSGAMGAIALISVKDASPYGLVNINRRFEILKFREKPKRICSGLVNAGAYIFSKEFIGNFPNRPHSVESEIFPPFLAKGGKLFGYLTKGYWNDIGTPGTYLKAQFDLINIIRKWGLPKSLLPRIKRSANNVLVLGKGIKIHPKSSIRGKVVLGNKVKIGAFSHVEDSVIMAGSVISEKVEVKGSIVGKNCKLGARVVLTSGSVIGYGESLNTEK